MKLSYLAVELALTVEEVEVLLIDMILDNRITASIDQINGYVLLENGSRNSDTVTNALISWSNTLNELSDELVNRTIC